jgi:hypothetical protein
VGGAAQAYEGVQNQMQKRAGEALIAARNAPTFVPGLGNVIITVDPKTGGPVYMPIKTFEDLRAQGKQPQIFGPLSGAGNTPLPPVPPIPAPSGIGNRFSAKSAAEATADVQALQSSSVPSFIPQEAEASGKRWGQTQADAENARNLRAYTVEMMRILSANPETAGVLSDPGPFAAVRAQASNALHYLAEVTGVQFNQGEAATDQAILEKLNGRAASGLLTRTQERSLGALNTFLSIQPGKGMPREAAATLASQLFVEQQRAIDKGNYAIQYGQRSGNYLGPRFDPAFDQEYSYPQYTAEQALWKRMMMDPTGAGAEFFKRVRAGGVGALAVEKFLAGIGRGPNQPTGPYVGMGRYFGSGG